MDNSRKPDRKNPRQGANPLSHLIFLWMFPLMLKGSKKGLNTDDLTQCLEFDRSEDLANRLEKTWQHEIEKAGKRKKAPSLKKAIFKTFYADTIIDGIYCFLFVLFRSMLPIVLGQLLLQFQNESLHQLLKQNNGTIDDNDQTELNRTTRNALSASNAIQMPFDNETNNVTESDTISELTSQSSWDYYKNDEFFLSGMLCLLALLGVLCDNHSQMRLRMFGARVRVACTSLIYRKTLALSKTTSNHTSTGHLINLISNDVGRFEFGFLYLHFLWITPIQVIGVLYVLWLQIGYAAFVGVGALLIMTTPVQLILSRLSSFLRRRVAERTDHRVGIMNEIVQGIQVIKMYAWEIPFGKVVANARKLEVNEIRKASYIRGFHLSIMVFIERATLFLTLLAIVMLNQQITSNIVFSLAQFFNVLQLTTAILAALALLMGSEAMMSVNRVQEYLLLDEKKSIEGNASEKTSNNSKEFRKGPASNKFEESSLINGKEEKTQSTKIIPQNGVSVGLDMSNYAISIKGLNAWWDKDYKKTLNDINLNVKKGQLCAIIGPVGAGKSSLLHLLLGELSPNSGISIINGSISYASQEPWLFSGTVIENILFGESLNKDRYNRIVYSCALRDDFAQLPQADKSHVGEHGAALSGGQRARVSLARAVYKKAAIYLLDDPLSAVDAHVGKHLFNEVIGPYGYLANEKSTRILVTHQIHFLKEADWIVIIENGTISRQGTYTELSNSDLDFAQLLKQDDTPDNVEECIDESDDDIPYIDGVNMKYTRIGSTSLRSLSKSTSKSATSSISNVYIAEELEAEEQAEGSIASRVWKKYFRAGASICGLIGFGVALIGSQIVTSGSDYFVNFWTTQEYNRMIGEAATLTTTECLQIYGALIVCVIFMVLLRSLLFVVICMRSSKNLHNKMFTAILAAPMRFFDTNPSGRILNRFSKDMGIIDEILPRVMMEAAQIFLVMIGILCMVCIVNPMMIIALAIIIVLFSFVLVLYLRPSQDMKRLEGNCRSPIFSYVAATFLGISTIRSRHLQQVLSKEFDDLQDVHTGIFHLSCGAITAFGLWLDLLSTSFVSAVTFSFITMPSVSSGNVGLAISQALILTGMVQYGIRQITETLLQMTSVERVIQYTDLKKEFNPSQKPPLNWPDKGHISMHKMCLRYDVEAAPVLKNLEIDIQPTWKVGIVGRTGAGKSSFINALFRMNHIDGQIIIDNVDTGTISLDCLRTRISIIPQEPVLFTDTIRNNLDPFHFYSDDEIWQALAAVELKLSIDSLDFMVTESGSNFSVGQRQLLCLARAILRNNKILVLDEATANVDPQTDALIQKTIRTVFKECTVLTIAHRLHTVMDSDRILVMDAGCAVEFDQPHLLLQHSNGFLRSMVDATGTAESDELKRVAKGAYDNNV